MGEALEFLKAYQVILTCRKCNITLALQVLPLEPKSVEKPEPGSHRLANLPKGPPP